MRKGLIGSSLPQTAPGGCVAIVSPIRPPPRTEAPLEHGPGDLGSPTRFPEIRRLLLASNRGALRRPEKQRTIRRQHPSRFAATIAARLSVAVAGSFLGGREGYRSCGRALPRRGGRS